MSSERRKRARTAFDGWVEVHTDGVRRLATGLDVSPDGIGLLFNAQAVAPRASVTCEFALPGISLPLELEGAVAWSTGNRAGIRFAEVDPGLAELLENHVAGRL